MLTNTLGQRVLMFRCVVDPMVGPKPRNAFVPSDMAAEAWTTNMGVIIKLHDGNEHLVPYTNIVSIRLDHTHKEEAETKETKIHWKTKQALERKSQDAT